MILCDSSLIRRYTDEGVWGNATLDALFRKCVRAHPDSLALADAPNRSDFAYGPPRRLTYIQANEIIDDLTVLFHDLRLGRDDVVAVQMPNTVEFPLVLLACFRAGHIVSVLPPLWREHELESALNILSPKVLLTQQVKGEFDYPNLMREMAAKTYSVRHVMAFGEDLPDGVMRIENAVDFAKENLLDDHRSVRQRDDITANDVAMITWNGIESPSHMPLPRSHNHLIAAGLSVLLESNLASEGKILCPFTLTNLGALGGFFVPWILTGSELHLHQPFDLPGFMQQIEAERPNFIGVPAAALKFLSTEISTEGLDLSCLKAIACLWPSPEKVDLDRNINIDLLPPVTDIFCLGELAIVARMRANDDNANFIPHGECKYPSTSSNGPTLLTTRLKGGVMKNDASGSMLLGELMLKSPMTYDCYYEPEGMNDNGFTPLERDQQGFIATGIRCKIVESDGPMLQPVWRINDIIYHGGLAVSACDLDAIYSEHSGIDQAAAVSIPDPILGERIAAAIVPSADEEFSFDDFRSFLENRKIAPYKIPDQVIKVDNIARDEKGEIIRHLPETST